MNAQRKNQTLNHPKRKPKQTNKQLTKLSKLKSLLFKCEQSLNDTRLPINTNPHPHNPLIPFLIPSTPSITPSMKAILFDWLMQVSSQFQLLRTTFHRSLSLVNQYLSLKDISKQHFQLLGVTCLFTSHKLQETQLLKIEMFQEVTNGGFTCEDILEMEMEMYVTLRWKIGGRVVMDVMWGLIREWDEYVKETDYEGLSFGELEGENNANISNVMDYLMFHNVRIEEKRLVCAAMYVFLRDKVEEEERQVFQRLFSMFTKQNCKLNLKQMRQEVEAVQYMIPSLQLFLHHIKTHSNQEPKIDTVPRTEQEENLGNENNKCPNSNLVQPYTPYLPLYSQFIHK